MTTKIDFNADPSWLETLSPLDNVYLLHSYWGSTDESTIDVAKIERITKTQIVLCNGKKFKRTDGSQVEALTKGKRPARIFPYSQENICALAESRLRRKLITHIEVTNLYALSTAKLESIVELIK
jgi:hypothetical protein